LEQNKQYIGVKMP